MNVLLHVLPNSLMNWTRTNVVNCVWFPQVKTLLNQTMKQFSSCLYVGGDRKKGR